MRETQYISLLMDLQMHVSDSRVKKKILLKEKHFCIIHLGHANLPQLNAHSLKPKARDSDDAFSSVTMSKSNVVRGHTVT